MQIVASMVVPPRSRLERGPLPHRFIAFNARWTPGVMDHPFVGSRDLRLNLYPRQISRRSRMKLRVVLLSGFPKKEFAAERGEIMELHRILCRQRQNRAIARERGHLSGGSLDFDGLIPFVFDIGPQIRPESARKLQPPVRARGDHRSQQDFVPQHENARLRIEVLVARKLYWQWTHQRISAIVSLAQISLQVWRPPLTRARIDGAQI